jgi:serine protease Do
VTNARRLILVLAASPILALPALAEDLECRWFIPATGGTVPVRCDDGASASPAVQEARPEKQLLGLTLAPLTQGLKEKYGIEEKINGVVVTQVDANSEAAGQGIVRGDIILETNRAVVSSPEDMVRSIDSATKDGRKAISLLLSNARGQTQVVSLSLGT